MNLLFIIVIVVLGISTIYGYWRGFIRIVFSLVSWILMIVLVSWVSPHITDFLKEKTSVYDTIQEKCTDQIRIISAEEAGASPEMKEISFAGIQLPKALQEQFQVLTTQTAGEMLEKNGVYDKAGAYLADWILRGISFFAALILVAALIRLVVGLLDLAAHLPVIKGMNRLLGIVAGLLQGLVFVWLFMFLVAITCTSGFGQQMLSMINGNAFLSFLYNYNGIVLLINEIFS